MSIFTSIRKTVLSLYSYHFVVINSENEVIMLGKNHADLEDVTNSLVLESNVKGIVPIAPACFEHVFTNGTKVNVWNGYAFSEAHALNNIFRVAEDLFSVEERRIIEKFISTSNIRKVEGFFSSTNARSAAETLLKAAKNS